MRGAELLHQVRQREVELYDLAVDRPQPTNLAGTPANRELQTTLRGIWDRLKECAGTYFQIVLPQELRVSSDENECLGRAYWDAVDGLYGWD